jgi:hypothetical protein
MPVPLHKRVISVLWKNKENTSVELFSNLKNFCLSYPQYNYSTLSNYLSKAKTPYENAEVRIERKKIINRPKNNGLELIATRVAPVVRSGKMHKINQDKEDLEYWLSQPAQKRAAAVTFIIAQSLKTGERMDKTAGTRRKMKP